MTYILTKKVYFFIVIILLIPLLALAHKPLLLVEENDDGGILIETGFSTGESAAGFKVFLKEKATGRILEVFTIPEEGTFDIPMPSVPYTVTFDAGEGHIVTKDGPFSAAVAPSDTAMPDGQNVIISERQTNREERSELLVVSTLPPLFWITSALCQESSIQVVDITPPDVAIGDQASWLHEHEEEVKGILQQADAVVTIRQTWSQDPLYRYARRWNINTIELDASAPFDPGLSGVSLLDVPADSQAEVKEACPSRQISPYIWLSLSNASTMADIVVADLKRLLPKEAEILTQNLARFQQQVFDLKHRYEMKFLELEILETAALTDRLIYLTSDANLPVTGYFLKDEYYWTPEDLELFKQTLLDNEVKVVIHTWMPKAEITQAIEDAGATLAVLDALESGRGAEMLSDSRRYLRLMEDNLETLFNTLNASQQEL